MTPKKFKEIRNTYLEIVRGKPVSTTWPDHLITDIILENGIALVKGESEKDPKPYYKSLDTWLTDNGE